MSDKQSTILTGKLKEGFASAVGVLLETQKFINSNTFLERKNDLKAVTSSIEKVCLDLQWCKKMIDGEKE